MIEAWKIGGWGMFPTMAFGLLAIAAAIAYALKPDRARLVRVCVLAANTMVAGLLATVTGIMKMLSIAAGWPNQSEILACTSESLMCVSLGLSLIMLVGIVTGIGASRSVSRGQGAAAASTQTA